MDEQRSRCVRSTHSKSEQPQVSPLLAGVWAMWIGDLVDPNSRHRLTRFKTVVRPLRAKY